MKLKLSFTVPGLNYEKTLYVDAPTIEAACKFISRESPGCDILAVNPANVPQSLHAGFAVSDDSGNRIS